MSENLKLWNAVVTTDPNYTKQFSRGGGFRGTAINFVYLARKATEQFGPMGLGWGANVIDERYMEGAPIGDGAREITHVIRIKFWYVTDHGKGEIESYGQTTYVGRNKNGTFTDEEAPKKSLTDAMSKAMSWLGFGADVHLGLFDDNKYVNDRKQEFGSGKSATVEPPAPQVDVESLSRTIETISNAIDWDAQKASIFAECQKAGDAKAWDVLKVKLAERAKAIGYAPAKKNGKANGAAAQG